jgi:hypothetical protein
VTNALDGTRNSPRVLVNGLQPSRLKPSLKAGLTSHLKDYSYELFINILKCINLTKYVVVYMKIVNTDDYKLAPTMEDELRNN